MKFLHTYNVDDLRNHILINNSSYWLNKNHFFVNIDVTFENLTSFKEQLIIDAFTYIMTNKGLLVLENSPKKYIEICIQKLHTKVYGQFKEVYVNETLFKI